MVLGGWVNENLYSIIIYNYKNMDKFLIDILDIYQYYYKQYEIKFVLVIKKCGFK